MRRSTLRSRSNLLWLSLDMLSVVIMVDLNEFHRLGKKHFCVIKLGPFHAADLIGIRLLTDEANCNRRLFFFNDVLSSTLNFALCHQREVRKLLSTTESNRLVLAFQRRKRIDEI